MNLIGWLVEKLVVSGGREREMGVTHREAMRLKSTTRVTVFLSFTARKKVRMMSVKKKTLIAMSTQIMVQGSE